MSKIHVGRYRTLGLSTSVNLVHYQVVFTGNIEKASDGNPNWEIMWDKPDVDVIKYRNNKYKNISGVDDEPAYVEDTDIYTLVYSELDVMRYGEADALTERDDLYIHARFKIMVGSADVDWEDKNTVLITKVVKSEPYPVEFKYKCLTESNWIILGEKTDAQELGTVNYLDQGYNVTSGGKEIADVNPIEDIRTVKQYHILYGLLHNGIDKKGESLVTIQDNIVKKIKGVQE